MSLLQYFIIQKLNVPCKSRDSESLARCCGWDTKWVETCVGEPEHFCDLSHGFHFALSNLTCYHLKKYLYPDFIIGIHLFLHS